MSNSEEPEPDEDRVEPNKDDSEAVDGAGSSLDLPRISDPFSGIDVGKIVPSDQFAKYIANLDFSAFVPTPSQALMDTIAKMDFGIKPILDAAVLKSLGNVVNVKPVFPPGLFDSFANFKFPELSTHPDASRAVESLIVPGRADEVELYEEVIEGELIDDDVEVETLPTRQPTIPEQILAAQQRTVELLAQSIAQTAASETSREATEKTNRNLKIMLGIGGLIITALGVWVAL